jgi:hypothetical protein
MRDGAWWSNWRVRESCQREPVVFEILLRVDEVLAGERDVPNRELADAAVVEGGAVALADGERPRQLQRVATSLADASLPASSIAVSLRLPPTSWNTAM